MWTRQHKRRRTGALIVPAIAAVVLTYFGFHAYHGEFGIYSKYRLEERTAAAQARLDAVRAEHARLEHRVALLRDGSLEKDMLDQQARYQLNLAAKNEVILLISRPRPN
jgi:cell division protein FtsB